MPRIIDEGSTAPDFSLPDDKNGHISSSTLRGHPYVLYFYPKDDTSGCTKEAIAFTELAGPFAKLKVPVVGVSKDSVASHAKFRKKHALKVELASDETGALIERYGAWVEKSMYGRTYMGIERSTFLVDSTGTVRKVWRKVKVPGHAEEVLDKVKELVKAAPR